jgi:membrane protein DedA with SNARE-associated domain
MNHLKRFKEFIEPGMFQFVLAVALIVVGFLWIPIGLPAPDETVAIATNLFEKYGMIVLLIGAFVEGIFMVNLYFPGSFLILLAILVSSRTLPELAAITAIAWVAFSLASALNYFLGRYGFYKLLLFLGSPKLVEDMRAWMNKRGRWAILLSAFHPNFLAISVVSMGVAREGFFKSMFWSMVSLLFWVPVLTALMAFILPDANETDTYYWYLVLILLAWGCILILRSHFRRKREVTFDS